MDEKVCKCVWNAQKITQNRLPNEKKEKEKKSNILISFISLLFYNWSSLLICISLETLTKVAFFKYENRT